MLMNPRPRINGIAKESRLKGAMKSWAGIEGSSFPQGVSWIERERAYNFALYSKHAESVTPIPE
jgi:glycogen operon protein